MDLEVSDDAVKTATKCSKGHECLKGKGAQVCKVERCIGGTVHYIESCAHGDCPYNLAFGSNCCCTCPVRKELYLKHKI